MTLIALLIAAVEPQPRLQPAALVQAALDCRAMPTDFRAAEQRALALGWTRRATRERRANGEPAPIFERGGAVLMLTPPELQEGRGLACGVIAPVAANARLGDFVTAGTGAFGEAPHEVGQSVAVWILGSKQIVSVVLTGPPESGASIMIVPVLEHHN